MDRSRQGSPHGAARQWPTSEPPAAPSRYHHSRSASAFGFSTIKRNNNFAAKAAAQRLARVMSNRDDDDDDDDLDFADAVSTPSAFSRNAFTIRNDVARPHSPAFVRNVAEGSVAYQTQSAGRSQLESHIPATKVQTEHELRPPVIAPLRTAASLPILEPPVVRQIEKRRLPISGLSNARVPGDNQMASELHDKVSALKEKNENMLEKLRIEDEKCEEAEARVKELEKQVASLSEGVSLEAKLLSRKEAILRRQEEELKVKQLNNWVDDEVASLRSKVKDLKDMKAATIDQLHGAEREVKALHSLTSRIVLTQKEMEEVVLKRCWLARYWGLAMKYGICEDAAVSKHEHWSSLAPLPFEIVLSAGQKAKDETPSNVDGGNNNRSNLSKDSSDVIGEETLDSMLSVEIGLQELSSLKVEDDIVRALSQHRPLNTVRSSQSVTELGAEETEDVLFKEAWLVYFWRRALTVGIEEHIAAERFKFWKERGSHARTTHDAVVVERGLVELRKLGIERRLWTAPRKEN